MITPVLWAAEDSVPSPKKKLAAISLLPDGSKLHGVMFPRYDENRHLIGSLKAKAMTLVNSQTIAGDEVKIEFFNLDGTSRGRADLANAVFNQTNGTLQAHQPVTLTSDRISAQGQGLIYEFEQGEGFLLGPVVTWMQAPTETTMNTHSTPLRSAAVAGVLATSALAATPPQHDEPMPDTSSKANVVMEAAKTTRVDLRAELDASEAATKAARAFLEKAEILSTNQSQSSPPAAEAKPLDVKPGPADTVIACDGGMYFDSDEGVFVYLKNVRVTDPRFNLTGAAELKIRLGKKPTKTSAKPDDHKTPAAGLGGKFGEVESVTANGAVRLTQKEVEAGKQPIEASGALFVYQPKSGQITLSGGYPWVMQGSTFMRAKEPNLTLRIQKTGSFVTEGNWEMGGRLDQKR